MESIPVIFLDRDGVINSPAKPHEYITRWEDFIILPGVYEALKLFHDNGYKIFIVTNQRGISRGFATLAQVQDLHTKMNEDFSRHDCCVDGIFICPHGYDDNCDCRKPKPGLMLQAQKWLEDSEGVTVDKIHSWMIGDSKTDEEAGINYGVNTALIGGEPASLNDGKTHLATNDILDSARAILEWSKHNTAGIAKHPETHEAGKITGGLNMTDYRQSMKEYIEMEIKMLQKLNIDELNAAANAITDCRKRGGTVYTIGNGGSAATASHMVVDFGKGANENLKLAGDCFRFECLADNVPSITAIANDITYDDVFLFQLERKLKPGDLLIAISGSGNSRNIIKAVEFAKSAGVPVVGISGYSGGKLKEMCDFSMHCPIDDMQIVEDIHMMFDHMLLRVFSICG